MAPQSIEKIESAPGNGAPMGRRPDRDERVGGSAAADRRTALRRRQAAAQHPAWELRIIWISAQHLENAGFLEDFFFDSISPGFDSISPGFDSVSPGFDFRSAWFWTSFLAALGSAAP
jgi:hypothetical protein